MQTSACNGRGREPRVNKLHARRGAADARQQKKFQLSSFDLSRSRQIKNYRDSEGHVQRQDGSLRVYPIHVPGGRPSRKTVCLKMACLAIPNKLSPLKIVVCAVFVSGMIRRSFGRSVSNQEKN